MPSDHVTWVLQLIAACLAVIWTGILLYEVIAASADTRKIVIHALYAIASLVAVVLLTLHKPN